MTLYRKMTSIAPEDDTETSNRIHRCKDCDEDCWCVPDKQACWFGGVSNVDGEYYMTDLADGYCPWLYPELEFPPKPNTGPEANQ